MRPIFGILVVSALLWVLSNSMADLGPGVPDDAPGLDARWDGRGDAVFLILVQCLYDISVVTESRAAALHPQAAVPNIEHWYRDRCASMVNAARFRLFSLSYGVRATDVVRRILAREAELVVIGLDDPLLSDTDVVAFWRAAAGRAAVDLDYFRRNLAALYAGEAEMPVPVPVPPSRRTVPVEPRDSEFRGATLLDR